MPKKICHVAVRTPSVVRHLASRAGTRRARFVDRARILVSGGDGGAGCASRFRDAGVEHGPADGGNGGRGGDVIIRACHNRTDLRLASTNFKAENGRRGGGSNMHGRRGELLELLVPCGTSVHRQGEVSVSRTSYMQPRDSEQTLLAELLSDGDEVLVAKGGAAGRGNAAFHSALAPHARIAEDGGAGEAVTLLLSLKMIADVGLVGFPNAGKSSLLRALSNATPKVASYPFTTLQPHLGRVCTSSHPDDALTLADIPGLVDGAHANRGLGHSFLRHIERTSLLCYVIDLADTDGRSPRSQLDNLRKELEWYKSGLSQQPCMLVANKADADGAPERLRALRSHVARLRARGELPGLLVAAGDPPNDSEARSSGADAIAGGASAVTAVSALHGKNLARLARRMLSNLHVARRVLESQADEERQRLEALSAREMRMQRAMELDRGRSGRPEPAAQRVSSTTRKAG
jgi:GTP-binding protein